MILYNLWVHMKERKHQQNGTDSCNSQLGLPLRSETTSLALTERTIFAKRNFVILPQMLLKTQVIKHIFKNC